MQNKPFIRIDNRLVMVMEVPKRSDHGFVTDYEYALSDYNSRPSYPINPADLDKFEEGRQYWENIHFKKKKVHVDADGNEAIVYTVGWKYFAFPLPIPNDRREETFKTNNMTAIEEMVEYFNSNKLWPKNEIWQIELDKKIGEWKELERKQTKECFEGLKKLKAYFLEHDKTTFEHWAYSFLYSLLDGREEKQKEESDNTN